MGGVSLKQSVDDGKREAAKTFDQFNTEHQGGSEERKIEITITKEELKEKQTELKTLFDAYPGEYRVYFNIDGQMVRTQTMIASSEEFKGSLGNIIEN